MPFYYLILSFPQSESKKQLQAKNIFQEEADTKNEFSDLSCSKFLHN